MRGSLRQLAETCRRALAGLAALVVSQVGPSGAQAQSAAAAQQQLGGASRLPVPRFVSLKSDRVNLRNGPGTEYPTSWVFRRAGLPVEILQEFEAWRQVRDADGATGWVLQSMLSGRRTALVLPWEVKAERPPPQIPLRSGDKDSASLVAQVEAGVLANVRSCDGRWCLVGIGDFKGYIEQKKLWGVYQGEVIK
jgi:SH3-like domain-containing protein